MSNYVFMCDSKEDEKRKKIKLKSQKYSPRKNRMKIFDAHLWYTRQHSIFRTHTTVVYAKTKRFELVER